MNIEQNMEMLGISEDDFDFKEEAEIEVIIDAEDDGKRKA